MFVVRDVQVSKSFLNEALNESVSSGLLRLHSMLQSMMLTFSRGLMCLGAALEYWYARVEITLSGNCPATLLTKARSEPDGDPSTLSMARQASHSQGLKGSFCEKD